MLVTSVRFAYRDTDLLRDDANCVRNSSIAASIAKTTVSVPSVFPRISGQEKNAKFVLLPLNSALVAPHRPTALPANPISPSTSTIPAANAAT